MTLDKTAKKSSRDSGIYMIADLCHYGDRSQSYTGLRLVRDSLDSIWSNSNGKHRSTHEKDKKILEDPTTSPQQRRHVEGELHELEVYVENHKDEIEAGITMIQLHLNCIAK